MLGVKKEYHEGGRCSQSKVNLTSALLSDYGASALDFETLEIIKCSLALESESLLAPASLIEFVNDVLTLQC